MWSKGCYPWWRSALSTSKKELFLLSKFDNSGPSVTRDLSKSHECEAMMSLPPKGEYPIEGTLWIRFTCSPSLMVYLLRDWRLDFQNGHFAGFERFKFCSHFGDFWQVEIKQVTVILFGQVTVTFLSLGKTLGSKKTMQNLSIWQKIKNHMHRLWQKSFSVIQSAVIKNCFPVTRPQSFLSVTRFFDLCIKIKYDKNKDTESFT